MTTNNQNLEESVSVSEGTTVSQGVNNNSNEEPTGQYPKSEYFFSSNLNYAATGAARNELYTGGGDLGLSLGLNEQGASEYPYNQVSETLSGHVIEVDDTPGNERILIKHRSGSGVELRSDGTVLVASTKNKVELTADDHTVVVEGEGNLVYKGNLNLKVTGDFNVECANFNVKSNGGYNMDVASSHRTKVGGNLGETVGGGSSRTSVGQVTNTSLGGFSNNVKGVYSNNVNGEANYVASGLTTMTSEERINISTPDLNQAASNLSIFGDVGTIGGENIIMYNYNMYTGHSIWATETMNTKTVTATKTVNAIRMFADTFEGDLDGTADVATTSQHQSYPDGTSPYYSPNVGSRGSITNTAAEDAAFDQTATALPTAELLADYLTKSQNGVRLVAIDDGDFIKKNIDKTDVYGGLSNLDLTTGLVRSRLRDQSNLNVEDFTSRAVAEGVLSPNYAKVAPTGIGRVVSGDSTPKFGQMKFGNVKVTSTSDPFLPRQLRANLIPDPVYNPDFQLAITSGTKLAPGVTMAKFLGSTGHATNLEFIKDPQQRKDLARQLYLHAEVMRSVSTNKTSFADYRLLVQEGVYRPGPAETPGGLNALKLSGRAVVYDLVDLSGRSDPAVIFDLAEYWKDTLYFDKMILSYDTYDPSKELDAQIIIIMPEIDEDWEGVFNRTVETQFNGKKMADGELVECITSPSLPQTTSVDPLPEQGGKYGVTTNKVLKPILYTTNGTSEYLQPGALENMQRLLSNEYAKLQEEFGAALTINDGLAKSNTGRNANPPSSQHFYGRAIDIDITKLNNEKKRKLVNAALKVGFTGIGLGNNIIHLDVRPTSRRTGRAGDKDAWNYSNAKFAGLSFDGYWNNYIET
jgi:hypothetical protein